MGLRPSEWLTRNTCLRAAFFDACALPASLAFFLEPAAETGCRLHGRAGFFAVGFLVAHPLGVAPPGAQFQKLLLQPVERLMRGHRDIAIGGDADQRMIPGVDRDLHFVQISLLSEHHVRFLLATVLHNLRKFLQLGFQLGALPRWEFLRTCLCN